MIKRIFAIDSAGEFMLVSSPNFSKNPIGNDINENSEFSHGQKMSWSLSLQDIVGRLK